MQSLIALALVLSLQVYKLHLHLWVHSQWRKCYGSNMNIVLLL